MQTILEIQDKEQGPLSTVLSFVSLSCWIFLLAPQQIRHYRTKSVKDISPYLLVFLFVGDVFNLSGCLLTHQLPFQIMISLYSISNDLVLFFQYWLYGLRQPVHVNKSTSYGAISTVSAVLSNAAVASAAPASPAADFVGIAASSAACAGKILAYGSSTCYIAARLPQLYNNFKSHTTRGTSPYFHGLAVGGCVFYTLSILTSNRFVNASDAERWQFFRNELPYMVGNWGSVALDMVYFYQMYLFGN